MPNHANRLVVWGALGAVYVIWGSTYLAIRIGVEEMPPLVLAGLRFLAAGLPLYLWGGVRSGEWGSRRQWRNAGLVGFLMLAGGNGLVTIAEKTVTSSIAALIITTVPLFMVGLDAAFVSRSRLDPWIATALGLGFGGVAVLMRPSSDALTNIPAVGAVLLLIASLSWAIGSLLSRRVDLPRSAARSTAMQMVGGGAVLLLLATVRGEWADFHPETISMRVWSSLIYLSLFGSIVALSAYSWLLQNCSAALVSTYAFVNPIVAVLLGWGLANEPLSPRIGLAGALIVGAVVLIQWRGRQRRQPDRPVEAAPVVRRWNAAGAGD